MWALVESGAVVQVFYSPAPFTHDGFQYPASWFDTTTDEEKAAIGVLPLQQDPIPAGQHATGSTYEVQPALVIEHWILEADEPPVPDALKSYAREKEFRVETGGIAFLGQSVPTDREAQGMYSRAAAYVVLPDPVARRVRFLKAEGFLVLTLSQASELARAVEEHVLLSVDACASIFQEIDTGVITTTAEIEESPLWPPNG